jgi:DNA-binding transcriptional ArsR family regulator
MTGDGSRERSLQQILDALSDPDCRAIVDALEEPRGAQAIAERCELPQTSTYRKLEQLCEAGILREGTRVRTDGHHVTTYEPAVEGLFVAIGGAESFDYELVDELTSADERLAQFWARISEEV